jgi:hypothetical protein
MNFVESQKLLDHMFNMVREKREKQNEEEMKEYNTIMSIHYKDSIVVLDELVQGRSKILDEIESGKSVHSLKHLRKALDIVNGALLLCPRY